MPYFRNFTYHIDKRKWKYYFLLATLCMNYEVRGLLRHHSVNLHQTS